jgi:hypothetical protein
MTISKEQREKNTHNKYEYIAGVGNKHGEMGHPLIHPQGGMAARATYEAAHDMGSETRRQDPEYAKKNWENISHKPGMKEHELPYWDKK